MENSRRALLHAPFNAGHPSGSSHPPVTTTGATPEQDGGASSGGSSFDANVVMILAVLLCALICALGINSIVRCALRCSRGRVLLAVDPEPSPSPNPVARSGVRRKALRAMPVLLYSPGLKLNAANPMCAICLSDFEAGEHVRVLPKCNHGFHVRCIDRWLLARSTCPTCRQSLFGAPHKACGCSDQVVASGDDHATTPASGPGPVVHHHSVLVPLRPEGLVTPYDF